MTNPMEQTFSPKNPDNCSDSKMLEKFITPQLSMSCDELELIRNIAEKVGIPFVLTKPLSTFQIKCTKK